MKAQKEIFTKLRKQAEKKTHRPITATGSKQELEHELNVREIELEMQYAELIKQLALTESLKNYSTFFDSAPVGYFILDKNGVIRNVNQTGCSQIGIDKMQLTGKPLSVFLSNEYCQDKFYRHRQQVLDTEKSRQVECEIKRKDGSLFIALIEISVVKENEHFKFFLSTISDITSRKEQELKVERALIKEKELNAMKSQFISIASHEFRTPLTTILSSTNLIEIYHDSKDEDKRGKHFQKIKTSVSRLKEILKDFLSISEVEKGHIKNSPETFNVIKFVEGIIEETKSLCGTHEVSYTHIGPYQNIFLDMKLLKICLTNLITNAYKYSPKGGLIEITTEQHTQGNVIFIIKDHGIGIPDGDAPNIFETFFRAKNAENIQGTGLGLNITQKFVSIMGGTISFISKENKGTMFILKFFHYKNT